MKKHAKIDARRALVMTLMALALALSLAPAVSAASIGEAKARQIAMKHAGIQESEARVVEFRQFRKHSMEIYKIVFLSKNAKFVYMIDASNGDIVEFHRNNRRGGPEFEGDADKNLSDYIGVERAKTIAFEHAKADASKVYKLNIDMDRDDGRVIYEVDFKHDGWEYEYEIDAKTGEIIHWDKDRD